MSGDYTLRLCEDRLPAAGRLRLPALNRVLYARGSAISVASGAGEARVAEGQAWHGAGACEVAAGDAGAAMLRYELIRGTAPAGGHTKVLREHAIDLAPRTEYLMPAGPVSCGPGR